MPEMLFPRNTIGTLYEKIDLSRFYGKVPTFYSNTERDNFRDI